MTVNESMMKTILLENKRLFDEQEMLITMTTSKVDDATSKIDVAMFKVDVSINEVQVEKLQFRRKYCS